MRKSSHVFFALLLPVSSLVACATDPVDGDDTDDIAGLETGAPTSPTSPSSQDPDSTSTTAADDALLAQVEFGAPGYNGNGCPQGTGSVALSADHRTLTVNAPAAFDATTTGGIADRRRICQTSVAVSAPAGIRLGIASLAFAGNAAISGTGTGRVTIEKRFPFGADDITNINVAQSGALALNSTAGVTWTECGGSSIAIASVALLASGTNARLQGSRFTATFVAERCQ